MNSHFLANILVDLHQSLTQDNPLLEFISQIKMFDEGLKESRQTFLNSKNNPTDLISSINSYCNKIETVRRKIKEIRQQPIFKATIKLCEDIQKYEKSKETQELRSLDLLKKEIELFEEVYQNVLQDYTDDSILSLIESSISLKKLINVSAEAIRSVILNLHNEYIDYEGLGELSLFFESNYLYRDFISKAVALQKIYSELCSLLSVSESDFPLRISKIESGSLWIKVFGETKIIEFFLSLIKDTCAYFYRNYTTEGKIEALPRKIETLESVFNLEQKLKGAGIDTKDLQDVIQRSAFTLGENLNDLIGGEAIIDINGDCFLIEHSKQQRSLVERKTPLLSSGIPQSDVSET